MKLSRVLIGQLFQVLALIGMFLATLLVVATKLGPLGGAMLGLVAICFYFLGAAVLSATNDTA